MAEKNRAWHTPIVLTVPPERLAMGLLCFGFFGLVFLSLGAAGGGIAMCAVGIVLLVLGVLWFLYRRGERISFEDEQVVVRTPFSQEVYRYEGMNFLLRRSWTVTFRRGIAAGSGLAGVAIQLRRGTKAALTVPVSHFGGQAVREAIAFLGSLPNPKHYL